MSDAAPTRTSFLPRTILGRATLVLFITCAGFGVPAGYLFHRYHEDQIAVRTEANDLFLAVALRAYLSGADNAPGDNDRKWLNDLASEESRVAWAGVFNPDGTGFEFRRNDLFDREGVLAQLKDANATHVFQPLTSNHVASKRFMLIASTMADGAGTIAAVVDTGTVPRITLAASIAGVAVCGVLAWIVGISFINGLICAPLRNACKGVNAVEEDLKRLADNNFAPPELGLIAKSLLALKREIARSRGEASQLRYSMERRVEARTKDAALAARRAAIEAGTDALTGLRNRRALENELEDFVAQHQKKRHELCALWIDLDNFKKLNDALGHKSGDDLLEFAGELLRATIRKECDRAYRYGGDEFVLLLSNLRPVEARHVAERALALFSQRVRTMEQGGAQCGMSIGIALLRAHNAANGDALLDLADKAMYVAKTRKNAIAFADEVAETQPSG
ncbi:MAG: diguanylate cyclase [Phycisphaerae bacterium]